MTMPVGYIWENMLQSGTTAHNSKNAQTLRKAKDTFVRTLPGSIRCCEPGAVMTREELERSLGYYQGTMPLDSYIRLVAAVAAGLKKGRKELGWDVPIPAIPVKVEREPARFTPKRFKAMVTVRSLEQAVLKSPRSTNSVAELGRLILSVILFGGLVHAKWLKMWFNAFNSLQESSGRSIRWDGRHLWMETFLLVLSGHKENDGSDGTRKRGGGDADVFLRRRWFADPITSMLICRWISDPHTLARKIPKEDHWFACVSRFLKLAGVESGRVTSPSALLEMAETSLSLRIPPFLAAYATRDVISVSVPEPVWTRLHCGYRIQNHTDQWQVPAESTSEHYRKPRIASMQISDEEIAAPAEQLVYLRQIRRVFYKNGLARTDRTAIRRDIQQVINSVQPAPVVRLLGLWSISLLTEHGGTKASSVRRYLSAIGGYLTSLCPSKEFLGLEPDEFRELYEQVIELIDSEKEKSYALGVLGRFHSFLVNDWNFQDINRSYFSVKKGPSECGVDANLVTCAEFDRIKEALGCCNPNRSSMATAALLIAILGFRCGLRRNEILYLRNSDLYGNTIVELVLKPHSLRGLKSLRSRRRLVLNHLLQPDEFNLLIEWWNQRLDYGDDALLFAPIYRQDRPFTEVEVFTPISQAIRRVTGDETLRFHHLRHSFATWMLLRLAGDPRGLRSKAAFLDHPEFDEERIAKLRAELLDNEPLGRKSVYAVAALCGHSNPGTTFNSYVHLCDWLLGQELNRDSSLPAIDVSVAAGLTGIPVATIYRLLASKSEAAWQSLSSVVCHRVGLPEYKVLPADSPDMLTPVDFPADSNLEYRWITAMRALKFYQVERLPILQVAELTRVKPDLVERWISEALYIAQIKNRTGYRHRIPANHLELCRIDDGYREVWRRKDGIFVKQYWRKPIRTKDHPKLKRHVYKELWKKSVSQASHPEWFPHEPQINRDREAVKKMMESFERLDNGEKQFMVLFSDIFCRRYSVHGDGIWFRNAAMAQQYIRVLRNLGVPASRIVLVELATSGESAESVGRRRAFWNQELGLTAPEWLVRDERRSSRRASRRVGIRVREVSGKTARSSYAVRYAMYLIRITYSDLVYC